MFIFQMLLRWNSKQTNIQNYWSAIIWLCCFAKKTTNGLLKSPSDQETKEKNVLTDFKPYTLDLL